MIVVFIVVLVGFGPQKLPELARGLSKLIAEFRKASTDFKNAFEEEMREMERQAMQAERKKAAEVAAASAAATETSPVVSPSTSAGTEAALIEPGADTLVTDDPVVSPVTESVPHSAEEPGEAGNESAAITSSQESPHDQRHPA